MRDEYKKELRELEERMEKAEKWAEKMPIFADVILRKKLSGERSSSSDYGQKYKSLYLGWNINRYFYEDAKNMTNCKKEMKPTFLWRIYINTLSVYNDHEKFGLEDVGAKDWFFYDELNTTFYVTDDQIEDLLESLNDWYLSARVKLEKMRKDERVKEIEAELQKLKED